MPGAFKRGHRGQRAVLDHVVPEARARGRRRRGRDVGARDAHGQPVLFAESEQDAAQGSDEEGRRRDAWVPQRERDAGGGEAAAPGSRR